jgi:hypothetical protein
VADVGDEPVLRDGRRLEPVEHRVERHGEVADLVGRPVDAGASVEPAPRRSAAPWRRSCAAA